MKTVVEKGILNLPVGQKVAEKELNRRSLKGARRKPVNQLQ